MTANHASKRAVTDAVLHGPLVERWSPRGFDAGHDIDDATIATLLEAARWAPSASNTQPWRFLPARRGTPEFAALTEVLTPTNRVWAPAASVLLLAAAQTTDASGERLRWAEYDTGQAVATLTVQAHVDGLFVHQMGGFDAEAVCRAFGLPHSITPLTVVAIGRLDPDAVLPEPLAERERAVRVRVPVTALRLAHPESLP